MTLSIRAATRESAAGTGDRGAYATSAHLILVLLALAILVSAGVASAQIQSSSTATTEGSECHNTNNDNKYCGFSVDILENSGDTFSSAYRWNINATADLFSSNTASSDAVHKVYLDILGESDAWYTLTLEQEWNGHFSENALVNTWEAEIPTATGWTYSFPPSAEVQLSGDLTLEFPGGTPSNAKAFNDTATAVFLFKGNGGIQSPYFEFNWSGRVKASNAVEIAIRMGQQNGSTDNCDTCKYPGSPSRVQENDGHFATFTLQKLCGNGVIDSEVGEECDGGSCCDSTTCTLDDSACDGGSCSTGFCSLQGTEGVCGFANVANGTACSDGLYCNGTDTCQSGECATHTGDPCAGNLGDSDSDCSESCNEGTDTCTANDPNNSACDDGRFCTASDGCFNGGCLGLGTPCPDTIGDSDADCSESCDEASDACTANDVAGVPCSDGLFCDGSDTCDGSGGCSVHVGNPCPGADGDGDCSESCAESIDDCSANDPADSACDDGLFCTGTDTCNASGACANHTGDPCPGPDGDTDCAESCSESTDGCSAVDPDGTLCRLGSDDVCDPSEVCAGGSCPGDAKAPQGTSCADDDVCDGEESCDGGGICLAGTGLDCDDGDLCTQDSCDSAQGCVSEGRPALACSDVGEGRLDLDERKSGAEKLVANFGKGPILEQTELGNPLSYGGTSYALCLYDALDELAAELEVDRAGLTCSDARKACWKSIGGNPPGGSGYRYDDREALHDGIADLRLRGNGRSASQAQLKASNSAKHGRVSLPTGVAAALEGHTHATMQLVGSNGLCLSADLTRTDRGLPDMFRGRVK